MAKTLAATLSASLAWTQINTLDLSTVVDSATLGPSSSITDGTGANQANLLWHDKRTIAASANDDIDLYGVLEDVFGGAVNFAVVKGLLIANLGVSAATPVPTAGETLTIGAATVGTEFDSIFAGVGTSKLVLHSGGILFLSSPIDGLAVVATTADILRISNVGASSIDYSIAIIGA